MTLHEAIIQVLKQKGRTMSTQEIAYELNQNFYNEVKLTATTIRNNIKELLIHFEINPSSLKIYLREDRDAG